jgi:serine/threonine protein kinase
MLLLAGNYHLQYHIGQGAFADVYLGKRIHLNTEAAIKILHAKLSTFDKQNFLREAQMIAKLDHQHIVRVLDFDFLPDNTPCLAMEYAAHGSLRQRHPYGERLTPTDILPYLYQLAEAVTYIHNKKIVHCDIKPENILLDAQNRVLLADFGIATLARQAGQHTSGTPPYMAPEQIQGQPESASDQYALAIVVYEWLCGRRPFTGQTNEEIKNKHSHTSPQPLRQLVPTLSSEIEYVVLQALAKKPNERFQNVKEFVTKFKEAAQISSTFTSQPTSENRTSFPGLGVLSSSALASTIYSIPTTQGGNAITVTQPVVQERATLTATELACLSHLKQGETLYELNLGQRYAIRTLAWSADSQTLAAGCDNHRIFTWDALTGQRKQEYLLHNTQICSIAWSPNGRLLASACANQVVHIWNPDEQEPQPLVTFRGHMNQTAKLGLTCALAWSSNSQFLASVCNGHTIWVWKTKDGTQFSQCVGHTDDINALCWSPDDRQVATASDDGSIRLWDSRTGQQCAIWQHHRREVYSLGWSHDGTLLASGGEKQTIYLWNPREINQPCYQKYDDHARSIYTLNWSPNSLLLATAGRDSIVHVWEATTRIRRLAYRGHNNPRWESSRSVLALVWSPDGQYIASSDDDGIVQVWKASG